MLASAKPAPCGMGKEIIRAARSEEREARGLGHEGLGGEGESRSWRERREGGGYRGGESERWGCWLGEELCRNNRALCEMQGLGQACGLC